MTASSIEPAAEPRRSRVVLRLIGVALLALVGVVVLEGLASAGLLLRGVKRLEPPPVQNFRQATYDSLLGWVSLPNLALRDNFGPGIPLTTNADGVRIHRPISRTLAAGEHGLICSGASFTFGSGVADGDTFCAKLERVLPGVRTVNLAQRGYGIDQSYLLYKRDAKRYAHDVQLFAINTTDVDRSVGTTMTGYPKPALELEEGRLVTRNVPVPQWSGWSRWSEARTLLPMMRISQLVLRRVDMSELAQYRRTDQRMWPMVDSLFADLVRLTRESGVVPVILYLPTQQEYAEGPRDERRTKLAASAQASGIAFIDLTPDLRAVHPDSLDWMYITPNGLPVRGANGHPTVSGHQWIAERTAAHLRRLPGVAAALGVPAE